MRQSHSPARLAGAFALAIALACWLLPTTARAQVHDDAHLFGQQAVADANTVMGRMEQQDKKQFVLETFPAVPDAQKAELQQKGDKTFFHDWMAGRAKDLKVNGVYALICMDPKYVEVGAGKETKARGIFTQADLDGLRQQLQTNLKAQQNDAALTGAVDLVQRAYTANIPGARPLGEASERDTTFRNESTPARSNSNGPAGLPSLPGNGGRSTSSGLFGIGPLICVGIGVLILFGLFRSLFNRGTPTGGFGGGGGGMMGSGGANYPTGGPTYGGNPGFGGNPGMGGSGGSGFGKGFLGGLLGGAVGGYAADRFEHRNDPGSSAGLGGGGDGGSSGGSFGGGGGSFDSGPSDAGAGFGDSSSGGDFSGGGGGGGDSGGGGGGDSGGGF